VFLGCGFKKVFVERAREMRKDDENGCDAAEALQSIVLVEAALRAELWRNEWESLKG
jgi:hypothetical protein